MVPLALGSQTIGSNVRPASYCGLVGLKPTFGRISTRGVMALSYTQDHVGLMARSVEDIGLLLSLTAGHDSDDPSSARAPVPDYLTALTRRHPPRIGLLREFLERATPEVADVTAQAVKRLARAGADAARARSRRHGDGRSSISGPVVAERPAVDHRALRRHDVGSPARHPARERHLHGSDAARGGSVV